MSNMMSGNTIVICKKCSKQSRPNGGERSVITIPVERNRDGYHNITINMDFNLPLGVVKISKEDGR